MQLSRRRNKCSNSVHTSSCCELLILVAQPRNLQKGINAVPLQTVQTQRASPVFGIDTTQGEAHAEPQIRGSTGESRERAQVRGRLEVSPAELVSDMELLHGGGHAGHLAEVLEALLALGALAEGPEVRQLVAGDAAAAI